MRTLTALTLVATHLLWGTGCTAQKLVPQPASKYAAKPPPPDEPVRVRGVLTKSGEKVEYAGERVALLAGDRVVVYDEAARLVTVDKKDAKVLREGDDILGIRVDERTYDDVQLVAETPKSISFVSGGAPRGEIPLGDIDEVWVEKKDASGVSKAVTIGLIVLAAWGVAVILYYAIGGPP
jgi:hypothetical protein